MRKIITMMSRTTFIIAVLLIFSPPVLAGPAFAPINPQYQRYIDNIKKAKTEITGDAEIGTVTVKRSADAILKSSDAPEGEKKPSLGLIPETFDSSHIRVKSVTNNGRYKDSLFPTQFDLRQERQVADVRDQLDYGTCWAFATIASAESGMIMNNYGLKDLSEKHLAYFAYEKAGNFPRFTKGPVSAGGDDIYDQGGNPLMSAAIFSRFTGPVNESDCRYPGKSENIRNSTPSAATRIMGQLRNMYRLSNLNKDGDIDNTDIKNALMEQGAVYVGISWDSAHYNESTFAYYLSDNRESSGHAVTIIGWDDNFAADNFNSMDRPSNPGAWLVRNSWGALWGDEGCFWLSYENANMDQISQFVIRPESAGNMYCHQYSYDPLGLISSFGTGDTVLYQGAIFKTEGDVKDNVPELIKAVGFYATDAKLNYRIEIRTGVDTNSPSSGKSAGTTQGTFEYAGYYTIELNEPAVVVKGENFSVIVRVEAGSGSHLFLVPVEHVLLEHSSEATANPGETFYSANGKVWVDMCSEDESANICIKAFTDEVIPTQAVNILPKNGATGISVRALLKTKGFETSYEVTHQATQWQVGINENFENGVVVDTEDDESNLLEYVVGANVLDYNTTYFWRARFKSSNGTYSEWSEPTSFTTVGTPAGGSGGGGCNTGGLAIILLLLPALIFSKKRER